MEINGREITFAHTVEAECRIADLCRDGDPANMGELFEGSLSKVQRNTAKFIVALSVSGEHRRVWTEEPGYVPKPLTDDEVYTLDRPTFDALLSEALKIWTGEDAQTTVETEPVKKNEV